MARQRPNQKTLLSFDGLTDAVTNLTGTLILLVVLILGVTHPAQPRGSSPEGEKPVEPLLRQLQSLSLEIQLIDREIRNIEQQLPSLRQRVKELRETSQSPPPEDQGVRQHAHVACNWPNRAGAQLLAFPLQPSPRGQP